MHSGLRKILESYNDLSQVEITKTTQLMTFIVHSVRNYIGF